MAAVYAVVAWLLVQIIVSIKGPLGLPIWTDTLVIVLVALGFPSLWFSHGHRRYGMCLGLTGSTDEAVEEFELAHELQSALSDRSWRMALLGVDPFFDSDRAERRVRELLANVVREPS